jgi:hypothetical protein
LSKIEPLPQLRKVNNVAEATVYTNANLIRWASAPERTNEDMQEALTALQQPNPQFGNRNQKRSRLMNVLNRLDPNAPAVWVPGTPPPPEPIHIQVPPVNNGGNHNGGNGNGDDQPISVPPIEPEQPTNGGNGQEDGGNGNKEEPAMQEEPRFKTRNWPEFEVGDYARIELALENGDGTETFEFLDTLPKALRPTESGHIVRGVAEEACDREIEVEANLHGKKARKKFLLVIKPKVEEPKPDTKQPEPARRRIRIATRSLSDVKSKQDCNFRLRVKDDEDVVWESDDLPKGLELERSGFLHGQVAEGEHRFTVRATRRGKGDNGGNGDGPPDEGDTDEVDYTLRAVQSSGPIAIAIASVSNTPWLAGILGLGAIALIAFLAYLAFNADNGNGDNGTTTVVYQTATPQAIATKAPAATATPAAQATTVSIDPNAFKGAEACQPSAVPGVDPKLQQAMLIGTGTWGVKDQPSCNPANWTVTGVAGGDNGAVFVGVSDMFIPDGTRLDYPNNTCDQLVEHEKPGIWGATGGKKITGVGPRATGWIVTGETQCPN